MLTSTPVLLLLGAVLLIAGAELLVKGASRLAARFGISPLVVGLTVVAFGTSAPEFAVTAGAAWAGEADLALGNVVGSNIFNVLFILGVSALVAPLVVSQQLVRLDVPLMIGVSLLVAALSLDGRVGRLDGALLFAGILAYTAFLIRQSRRESAAVRTEYDKAFGEPPSKASPLALNLLLIAVGLGMLALGARWLVAGAVAMAQAYGVSELVIGLTIVAAGTSLPEVATSVLASIRGERDIAVGNVVGSNLFNLLGVLGFGGLIAGGGIPVAAGALTFDIPVMIGAAIVALPIFFTGYRIGRREGALLLAFYIAYVGRLVMVAAEHPGLPQLETAMIYFVLPLTAVTLAVLAARAWQQSSPRP
ncbi:MAG: calcium/sodium antiporter [Acidobacteria bacterium]|nr:calcium/sodium antiporter [Acidobacteriota bacterium]